MSRPLKTDFMALIAGEVAPASKPDPEPALSVVAEPVATEPVVRPKLRPVPSKRPGIKERTHQFSLYIEPEVYEVLRSIAFEERIKLHALVTEGLDMVLKRRGEPSIRELIKRTG